ncbi:cyclic di-GMP phosphodiesterase response regulator RpfG [mine drainage metagenome]|uniref:Cyclic di-GMP phosphodiesterase response regulator RpfG n=1 Tax=mine drainage metagenome TaxID=410659 RepID=A0A1J5RII5_9ZZZZ
MMQNNQNYFIHVYQLRTGLFVHLDLGWMDHPFTSSNFKLRNAEQIEKIKKIGLKKLRYDPSRSDCEPLAPNSESTNKPVDTVLEKAPPTAEVVEQPNEDTDPAIIQQEQRINRLIELHKTLDESEKKFVSAGNTARQSMKNIISSPKQSLENAEKLVNELVDSALGESEIAILAVNGNRSNDSNYVHSLNVTVLALMLARSLNITEADARLLGMAALFHDIGKMEISDKVLLKKDPLTKSEQAHYELHTEIGERIAKQVGMSERIAKIIMQHHECADGTGYPKHLQAKQTDPLARLVELINGYDNLCNPPNIQLAKTPYEALAHMFAHQRSKYDDTLLKHLIKSLGIYPPGSIVQLSNGLYGVVVAVNPVRPLRPVIMMHDTQAEKHPPPIINLQDDPNISISICLRPNQLPEDALQYLNPRKRISYFMDTSIATDAS